MEKRLALVTCADLPDWEVDDRPLHAALDARGVAWEHPSWDDASVDWSAFASVLVRTPWDYCERIADFTAWIARTGRETRLFNPPGVLAWNLDKRYLRDLERAGVALAPTVWLDRGTRPDLPELLRDAGWERAFLKPIVGASARETLRFDADAAGLAAANAHVERLLANESLMLQPYLPAVESEGELSTVHVDGAFAHGVRKVPVAGDYRVQDDFWRARRALAAGRRRAGAGRERRGHGDAAARTGARRRTAAPVRARRLPARRGRRAVPQRARARRTVAVLPSRAAHRRAVGRRLARAHRARRSVTGLTR